MANTPQATASKKVEKKVSPPMRYQFIDASNDNPNNLTQVKRHVMQEFMRQKRHQAQQEPDGDAADPDGDPSQQKRQRRKRATRARNAAKDSEGQGESGQGKGKQTRKSATVTARPRNPMTPASSTYSQDPSSGVEELSSTQYPVVDTWLVSHPGAPVASVPGMFDSGSEVSSPGVASSSHFLHPYTQPGYGYQGPDEHASHGMDMPPWSSGAISPFRVSPTPQTVLSAARTDPFDTLPMKLDRSEQLLFDFYVNTMPSCSYGFQHRSSRAHNWYTQVFVPEAMKGAICFQNTILVHAANTQAWVRNLTETSEALYHRGKAINMLRTHFEQNPKDISDAAISATLSAAACEDFDPRPERREVSWIHMRRAMQMIRDRGGPAAFQGNRRMAMLINWSDYIFLGYESNGPSFFFEHNPTLRSRTHPPSTSDRMYANTSIPSPPISLSPPSAASSPVNPGLPMIPMLPPTATPPPLDPLYEIQTQCEEFLDFLRQMEQLSLFHKFSSSHNLAPRRYATFRPGSHLHRILAAPPGLRYNAPGQRKQIISRLATLMMLNAALLDYQYSIEKSEAFLKGLVVKVLDSEVDVSGSVEAVLQIMLAGDDTLGVSEVDDGRRSPRSDRSSPLHLDPQLDGSSPYPSTFLRPWFVGRMVKIAKRLGPASWGRVNDMLLSALTLEMEGPTTAMWEAELRREIMEAPLTSYVMPIMQQ